MALLVACGGATSPIPEASAPAAADDARAILDDELAATARRPEIESALAVVLDARDGRVVAMQSFAGDVADPELPARERRSHGSVGKVFTYAIALERGVLAPTDRLEGTSVEIGGERIHDREERVSMSVEDALAFSSNVGAVHVLERLGAASLVEGLTTLHLGTAAGATDDPLTAARLAYGPALEATPLEMASAFAAVVNGGVYHAPWRTGEPATEGERVVSAETSRAMSALLEATVTREDGTGHGAAVPGLRVAGKTGTMPLGGERTHGAFVGVVSVDAPRYVIVVDVITRTGDYSGGTVAAPLFARIATRLSSL
ncbi:MAG: penicillin-binding transpeptidase domain-containing protein [Sandaracinus sp.]